MAFTFRGGLISPTGRIYSEYSFNSKVITVMTTDAALKSLVVSEMESLKTRSYECQQRWAGKLSSRQFGAKDLPALSAQVGRLVNEWENAESVISDKLQESLGVTVTRAAFKPLRSQRGTCLAILTGMQAKATAKFG
jgi:hypothetical protein